MRSNKVNDKKTPVETLRCVRDLLLDPRKWTKRVEARDKDNRSVTTDDPRAYSFCIIGATKVCEGEFRARTVVYDYVRRVMPTDRGSSVSSFNDNAVTTHKDVITTLNNAIALAKKESRNG
jgi:hypothetical protein